MRNETVRLGGQSFDIVVADHGSVMLIQPTNALAQRWLSDHVAEEAMWWGDALVAEGRYVEPLLCGAIEDGFTVGGV